MLVIIKQTLFVFLYIKDGFIYCKNIDDRKEILYKFPFTSSIFFLEDKNKKEKDKLFDKMEDFIKFYSNASPPYHKLSNFHHARLFLHLNICLIL